MKKSAANPEPPAAPSSPPGKRTKTGAASGGTSSGGNAGAAADTEAALMEALSWLRETATPEVRQGMARFGIPSENALGVSVGAIQKFAKPLGRNRALSAALWATEIYEARHLAVFVGDPAILTPEDMDCWCADFDSWAICDAACMHLFDRSPHAFSRIMPWAAEAGEFQKRAAFALLASLALHDRWTPDEDFSRYLPLIESCAGDERNFVKKAVNWALRAIGSRNTALHAAALETAGRLAGAHSPAARWTGKDALRQLASPATRKRLSAGWRNKGQ